MAIIDWRKKLRVIRISRKLLCIYPYLQISIKIKMMSKKDVMSVTGAGQLSMAIARRVGYGKKIVMGDKNINNAKAQEYGKIKMPGRKSGNR